MNDRNVEILSQLGFLRCLSATFKGRDELCYSLGISIGTITDIIVNAHGPLYNITFYRESQRKFHANGVRYHDIKKLKITKDQYYSLFRYPHIGHFHLTNREDTSIKCCIKRVSKRIE